MDEMELCGLLDRRIERARHSGLDSEQARKAVDYYLSRPRGDEVSGRSQVQSADVADMVHAVLAQLQPAFAGDSLCEFEPSGPGDEIEAAVESRAVNQALMETNRGYVAIQQALHNALLMGAGVLKLWSEGKPRRLMLAAVDPLNFYVDESHDSPILDHARGVYERKEYTRGELVDMGLPRDKVADLPILSPDYESDVRKAGGVREPVDTGSGWAAELVEVWECHVRIDMDPDGESLELWRILKGEGCILLKEQTDSIPYAMGSPIILPSVAQGLGLYDRLKSVQDAKTSILRQMLDSFAASNLSRLAVNGEQVNMDDLLTGRVNGVVRVRGIPAENVMPIPNQDISAQAIQALQYQDKVRSDRAGASLEMQSSESQLIGSQIGATGAMMVMGAQEQVACWYAQNLAQTLIRSAFQLAHRLLRTEVKTVIPMQVADQWVEVDPTAWPARDRVNISAGLSPGERTRRASALQSLVGYQTQLLTSGFDGLLVTPTNLFASLMAWGRAAGIDGIDRMFTDPNGQGAQQAAAAKGQQAQQMQALQVQLEQAKIQIEGQKLELDKYKHDSELKWKYYDTDKDNEAREAEIVGGAARDIALAGIAGQATARGEAGSGGDRGQGRKAAA